MSDDQAPGMTAIYDWQCDVDLMDVTLPDGAVGFHSADIDGEIAMSVEATRHVRASFERKRSELGLNN